MAGIIQAPNRYSPHRNPEESLRRRNHILDLLMAKGFITESENARARETALEVVPLNRKNYTDAPYFVDYIRSALRSWDTPAQPGAQLEVYTTLDPELQRAGVIALQEGLEEIDGLLTRRNRALSPQAALLAVDPRTGEILAMVGSADFDNAAIVSGCGEHALYGPVISSFSIA